MAQRSRPVQLICRVTKQEKDKIIAIMKACGYQDFSKYARRMLLAGHILVIDWDELVKLRRQISGIATNINQIAYRANSTRYVRQSDIIQLRSQLDEIIRLFGVYLDTFEKIDDLVTKASG